MVPAHSGTNSARTNLHNVWPVPADWKIHAALGKAGAQ